MSALAIPILLQSSKVRCAGVAYVITNRVNGKRYVGITSDPAGRVRDHLLCVNRKGTADRPLYAAIRKYGIENFDFTIIASAATWDGLLATERWLIAQLGTYTHAKPGGYNLTFGGEGVLGFRHAPETVERMRLAASGKVCSEVTRAKLKARVLSDAHLAKLRAHVHSPEMVKKLDAARRARKGSKGPQSKLKGSKLSPERVEAMRVRFTGTRHSDETRARMSAAHKGQVIPLVQRAKIAESNRVTWITRRQEMDRAAHPRARSVITPFGAFPSCALAGEAIGMDGKAVYGRASRNAGGWSFAT